MWKEVEDQADKARMAKTKGKRTEKRKYVERMKKKSRGSQHLRNK